MKYNKMSIHAARVNVKSLAAEAIIIRKEMGRASESDRCALYIHKTNVVKKEARLANLALAFLRGQPYKSCEITNKKFDINRLIMKINRFIWANGYNAHLKPDADLKQRIVDWINV